MKEKMSELLESHPGIPLKSHLIDVSRRMREFCEDMGSDRRFCHIAYFTGLLHDLGKVTPYFQSHLKGEQINERLSSHALLSAVIAVCYFANTLETKEKLSMFMAIRAHHSNPYSPGGMVYPKRDWKILQDQFHAINKFQFYKLIEEIGLRSDSDISMSLSFKEFSYQFSFPAKTCLRDSSDPSLYFTINLLLGMLVDADIRAVIEMEANEKREEIPEDIVDRYIKEIDGSYPIDSLRREFYDAVIGNIVKYGLEHKFFSITAPTGIGKTLAGLSSAIKLRNLIHREINRLPRIIYVLPFTSIIDQNYELISRIFRKFYQIPSSALLKHHFRSSPEIRDEPKIEVIDPWKFLNETEIFKSKDILKQYERAYTQIETWDSEVIVTTFVRFYDTLFTNRRSEMRRLHRLAGSIVILDEVQNIPVRYWEVTERTLEYLAESWDTRFILMTATRPSLLSGSKELTEPKKEYFFGHHLISRTCLNIDLTQKLYTEIENWLLPAVASSKSFMVILNTVRSAQQVYKMLKERLDDYRLFYLSASLIPKHREQRIRQIRKNLNSKQKTGLIATQVVEAGVDLDFETVIRDFSPLDSIVQSAGRCNRNAKGDKIGKVFLTKLTDNNDRILATYIYDPVLLETGEKIITQKQALNEKGYLGLVESYFSEIRERKAQEKKLTDDLVNLNYSNIDTFSLIQERIYRVPVFVEFDKQATELVERLESLQNTRANTYAEKMQKRNYFKTIQPELWGYIVNVPVNVVADIGLPKLPYAESILWLPREHYDFREIYDAETGFAREIEHRTVLI